MAETLTGGPVPIAQRLGLLATRLLGAVALVCTGAAAVGPGPARAAGLPTAVQITVVPEPGTTLWVDGRPYAGELTVTPDRSGLAVVNRVAFEDYVAGIGEMPSSWPGAALQAQAVAARTYALWTVLTHRPGPGGGQICASDYCQVYSGLAKTEGTDGGNWMAAVRATSGRVLTYDGRIIESVYGSSDGGQTLSGGVPWLPSVADPEDALAPEHQWSWSGPLAGLAAVLGVPAGEQLVSLVSSPSVITETLRVAGGATATRAVDPSTFHDLLNARLAAPAGLDLPLPSWRYSVSTYGTEVRIAGYGDGQGMGMSQYGALGKAEKGYSASQILGSYYGGAVLDRLPASELPTAISVTLDDPVASALIQASGPVQITGPDRTVIGSTSGAASWQAHPGGAGVDLVPVPGGPPGSPPPTAAAAPPAPITAPPPGPARTAPPAPASTTTSTTPPTTAAATPGPPEVATRTGAPDSVVAAYQRSAPPEPRPTGWAVIALLALVGVSIALARAARLGGPLSAAARPRPSGAHYRRRSGRRGPTANG